MVMGAAGKRRFVNFIQFLKGFFYAVGREFNSRVDDK